MTGSANDVVLGKHLEAASNETKTYVLRELLTLSQAIAADIASLQSGGSTILDSVPASVDGGLWYEIQNAMPVIKFYQGGHSFSLSPTMDISDPQLTLSPAEQTVTSGQATINISYLGDGVISWSTNPSGSTKLFPFGLPWYDSGSKRIYIPYSEYVEMLRGDPDITISVTLSADNYGGYTAATASAVVHMPYTLPLPLNPDDPLVV